MIRALLADVRLRAWFYGYRAPERGAITLGQRRVYILPTRLGWLYGATLGILLVGSINYALQLGFALTFLLAGLGLVAMVHTTRNLARLTVSAGRAEPVFAGEAAQFRLYLDNRARFDRPAILVRHQASGAQVVLDLAPGAVAEAVLAVPAAKRGWLALTRVLLETRFPLGLFRAWSYVEPAARCLVYPRPERTPLPAPTPDAEAGAARAQAQGSDDFSGLRAYQLQDSPRHVAWKAVARSDDMLTKQFAGAAGIELWLDWTRFAATLDAEQRLSRLAGWVLAAEQSGARYGLRLPGCTLAPDRGDAHHAACLQALALYGIA
ncbi:MAG: DUF58 domain-containing protein [Betaproteobacteria bacterium]|nr:DUF58 domain-containing protein [Betaproteobacteria bacterium]